MAGPAVERNTKAPEVPLKAAICTRFGAPLSVEDITLAPPGEGEVEVTLKACGICHSDIHFADGAWGGALPVVLGHEGAGIVESVGAGVTGCRPGDRVAVGLMRYCGSCFHCHRDEPFLCDTPFPADSRPRLQRNDGSAVVQGLRTGAFAEAVVVDQSQVVVIPDDVPFEAAALATCGVLTGWGAVVKTAGLPPGQHIGVIGVGGVGINSVQAAAMQDPASVVAIDFDEAKLDLSRSFGATHTINGRRDDAAGTISAITVGRGLDYVFVTVGKSAAVAQGLSLLRRGGTLVMAGMPENGDILPFQTGDLASNSQRILGSKMGCAHAGRDLPEICRLYQQGRFKLDELVSARYPLTEINTAIAAVKTGQVLRNVITF